MAKREREREAKKKGGGEGRPRSEIEVRPRISFSPGLQFEDVVAFVPPVYTRYAKGVRRGSEGGQREGGDERRGAGSSIYLLTRSTRAHALARVDVYTLGTWTPARLSAFLPRTLGVVLPFSSSSPRLTCPISPHWPRECEHVEARFESREREACEYTT